MSDSIQASFSTLIMSIASSSAVAMGLAPSENGQMNSDPLMARFHIDLLKILELKTQNNLTAEEKKLLQQILMDLQMKYVEASKRETL